MNSPNTFYTATKSTVENSLSRNPSTGAPFFALSDSSSPTSWLNYAGVSSIFTDALTGGSDNLHAFIHAEDHYHDEQNLNPENEYYARIGYSRATSPTSSFSLISTKQNGSTSPYIISSFQDEDDTDFVTAFNPQNPYSGGAPGTAFGVGSPSVIEDGSYYYMVYTRWLTEFGVPANMRPTQILKLGSVYHSICVARALKSSVLSPNFASNENPWKNYYNGSWNTDALGGYASGVIPKATNDATTDVSALGGYRAFPVLFYVIELSEYAVICTGPTGFIIHLTINEDLSNWTTGQTFLTPQQAGVSALLYPSVADDMYGDDDYVSKNGKLYYGVDTDGVGGGHTMERRSINFSN